jgi:hypothetical protein
MARTPERSSMRAGPMVPGPVSCPCCSALGSPRSSAKVGILLATEMSSTVARAATATSHTGSATRNANGFFAAATSLNSLRFRLDRSCRCGWIVGRISTQSATSTGCCMPTIRFTGGVVHGHHRNHDPCHASKPLVQTRCGAGTSPSCRPPCTVCRCTSTW